MALFVSAGIFGAAMGSAMTAIVWRIPRGVSWVQGRSACPRCGHVLGPLDLVPIVSWLIARGRCRHCGEGVPVRYPVTELLCAAWAILLLRQIGLGWAYPLLALWGFLMIALLWIDLDHQLLPDVLTLPGTVIGIAAALSLPGGARHALFGVIAGSGILALISWAYWRVRKIEGMGGGDIKLAAMFGSVLGWQLALVTLFVASLAGAVWGGVLMAMRRGDGRTALPFGTLLAPAALVVFLWGETWRRGYLNLLR